MSIENMDIRKDIDARGINEDILLNSYEWRRIGPV